MGTEFEVRLRAVRHFDIQSQVASLALKEFARQADISLVFSSTASANPDPPGDESAAKPARHPVPAGS